MLLSSSFKLIRPSILQGTIEKPGLASLTINELLLMAKEKGKSVSISYYEVYMDYVYDLLDPKRATVLVLDNGQGKIQLKGLSRVSSLLLPLCPKF